MAIGEALGGILGGLLGQNAAKSDRSNQKELMNQMIAEYQKIGYPPDYSKELILQQFQQAGIYTPELEQDLNDTIAESQVGKIQEDSSLRDAQKTALNMMQQRAKVGLSAEDRAALNQVRQQVQQDSQAKQGQILQEMQARGQGGGGAELAAKLQAAQSGADRASAGSDTIMAQAQQRALDALGQSANQATQVRSQDFSNAQAKAQALDERNKFLAQNSINRQSANVQALNQAQQQNLVNKQASANSNVNQANEEKRRQVQAQQQQYQDKLAYAAGITGKQGQVADYRGNLATQKAEQQQKMGAGIGGLAGDVAGMISDENLKDHVEFTDEDVQKWLDSLSLRIKRKNL